MFVFSFGLRRKKIKEDDTPLILPLSISVVVVPEDFVKHLLLCLLLKKRMKENERREKKERTCNPGLPLRSRLRSDLLNSTAERRVYGIGKRDDHDENEQLEEEETSRSSA